MPRIIHKAKLSIGHTEALVPAYSQLRHVAMQGHDLCLWYSFEAKHIENTVSRNFYVLGTGQPLVHDSAMYIGTVMDPPFVWHVWEIVK